jgi:hypothetical protein
MEDEEKYRVESTEEETTEKKGLMKPLPQPPSVRKKTKQPTPIVTFFGISMSEKRKNQFLVLFIPLMAAVIDTNIMAYIFVNILDVDVILFFVISLIIAIPVGLTQSNAGHAVIGALLNSIFFMIFFIIFLISPSIIAPSMVSMGEFLIAGVITAIGYFVLNLPAAILGSFFGQIVKELF